MHIVCTHGHPDATTNIHGVWIAIDGVDSAGKTSLTQAISELLPGSVVAPEFSASAIGKLLRSSLGHDVRLTALDDRAQAFLFLSEYLDRVATVIAPLCEAGTIVISDRGHLSKIAFQAALLSAYAERGAAANLAAQVVALARTPDVSIHLFAPIETIAERLATRGRVDPGQLGFLSLANDIMIETLPSMPNALSLDSSSQTPEQLAILVRDFLINAGLLQP